MKHPNCNHKNCGVPLRGGLLLIGFVTIVLLWLAGCQTQVQQPSPGEAELVTVGSNGATLNLADGAQLTLPPEGIEAPLKLKARTIPADQLPPEAPDEDPLLASAVSQLPPNSTLQSAIYRFELDGPSPSLILLTIPDVAGATHNLDMYGWDGESWRWLPSQIDAGTGELSVELESLPSLLALLRLEAASPIITADLPSTSSIPTEAMQAVSELLVTGYTLQPDGGIEASPLTPEVGPTVRLIPSLRNWRNDGSFTADTGLVLADPTLRRRQIDAVLGLALAGGQTDIIPNAPVSHIDWAFDRMDVK